jgi:CBS domain-containing protein
MKAKDVMSKDPSCCTADQTVRDAARLMVEHDCGCIPIVDEASSKRVIGTITDRDIACRCTAEGRNTDTRISEVMSPNPVCCRPEDEVSDIERVMSERKVRRVPIVDDKGRCVGIVAQADLARASGRGVSDREVSQLVERVSEPTREARVEAR